MTTVPSAVERILSFPGPCQSRTEPCSRRRGPGDPCFRAGTTERSGEPACLTVDQSPRASPGRRPKL